MSRPVEQHLAGRRAPGQVSCIRLRHRSSVDLPHPDGPMIAVTNRSGSASETAFTAACRAEERVNAFNGEPRRAGFGRSARFWAAVAAVSSAGSVVAAGPGRPGAGCGGSGLSGAVVCAGLWGSGDSEARSPADRG